LVARGVQNLTVSEVAAESGVHETTIYRRWRTIPSLALDACLHEISTAIPVPQCGSLHADLVSLIRSVIDLLGGPDGRALLDICRIADPEIAERRADFFSARFEVAGVIFDRAAARGEWDMRLDWKPVLELLIAPIYLRALVTQQPLRAWPVDRIVRLVLAAAAVGSDADRLR
jgi:AcrR family transcriptional regulator